MKMKKKMNKIKEGKGGERREERERENE